MNTLETKIQKDLVEAMKSHQESAVSALRLIKTAIQNEKTNGTYHELSDDDIIKVIQKLVKQHQESIDIYRQAGRDELANAEQAEMDVLVTFLPKMLSEDELTAAVDKYINENELTTIKDMGKVMKFLGESFPNQYDGKLASTIVRNRLNK